MKKFTPILIISIIILAISISGCISTIEPENTANNTNQSVNISIENINQSGNIKIGTQDDSNKIKNELKNTTPTTAQTPKISKEEIEKEVVRIMKLNDPYLNYTANATLTYTNDQTPYYLVDVYDDYGWYGYFEINANKGPVGNDKNGYSFDGGAVRGETGDQPSPIQGVMPKLSHNDARSIMDKQLQDNYTIYNTYYTINGYLEENTPYYNITIEEFDEDTITSKIIGTAIMDANTGELISMNLENDTDNSSQKIYSVDEAGAYVDIVYKGKNVSVRENYPYYSPQNNKIYYSQEEEAEDLIKLMDDMN